MANGDHSAIRLTPCTKCGGVDFYRVNITDPRTGKVFELRSCKTCEDQMMTEVPARD